MNLVCELLIVTAIVTVICRIITVYNVSCSKLIRIDARTKPLTWRSLSAFCRLVFTSLEVRVRAAGCAVWRAFATDVNGDIDVSRNSSIEPLISTERAEYVDHHGLQQVQLGDSGRDEFRSASRDFHSQRTGETFHNATCIVCFDSRPQEEIFRHKPCGHRLCTSCLHQYVQGKLQAKSLPISCAEHRCGETLTPEACRPFLCRETIGDWETLEVETMVVPLNQRTYCPFCAVMLIGDDDIIGGSDHIIASAECPNCHRLFCRRCLVPWHADLTCAEYRKRAVADPDRLFHRLAKNNKWMRCKACKRFVDRAEGCNHMTCRCGHQFCYECGARWTQDNTHICKVRRWRKLSNI